MSDTVLKVVHTETGESLLISCNLAEASSPVTVNYCEDRKGWEIRSRELWPERKNMIQFVHRNENGSIAWSATIRFLIALVVPFFDGDAPGRAYTPREQRLR